GDLGHQLGPDVHGELVARNLEREELLRLPAQHLVGEPLERLAEHHELPGLRITGAEVEVGEPAPAPPAAVLHGQDDEIEGVGRLELQPVEAAMARGVGRGERLGHQALVSLRQRLAEKACGFVGGAGVDPGQHRARAKSTTSGTRAVTSWRWRVNTRTSSPALWSWMRAPSSLYSKAAGPSRSSAASTSSAVLASMGATGERSRSEKRPRPAAPSSSAARATSPTLPEYIAACRTLDAGSPEARAIASSSRPSSAPCRSSPISSSMRKRRSSASARAKRARRACILRSPDPAPRSPATASHSPSTSASVSRSPASAAGASGTADCSVLHPRPM